MRRLQDILRVLSLPALLIVLLLPIAIPSTTTDAAPLRASIGVSPSSGPPGTNVTVSGNGFTPGGYQGRLFWDGSFQKSFSIPSGGSFSTGFTIPSGTNAGNHTIRVCAASGGSCFTGEFAQEATTTFNVIIPSVVPPTATAVPTFNIQPAGIEVTQGIRQDIPSRTATGDLVLRPENWTHVAGRRTIVRVYPLLVNGPTTQVTALLYGQRDGVELPGSPLQPERKFVIPRSTSTLEDMRRDVAQSWIFVLPESWTDAGSLALTTRVNPTGPDYVRECPGCDDDNTAYLSGVSFEQVQAKEIWVQIIRTNWFWRDATGAIVNDSAEIVEIFNMLLYWQKTWPIDESLMRLYPIRQFRISHGDAEPPIEDPPNWDNNVFHDVFGHLYAPPSGRNDRPAFSTDPYVYVPTVFDPDSAIIGCSGVAGIGYPPLFHTGACWAAAQEAGHSIGLNHASNAHGERNGGPVDPSYPGDHGQIEEDAFGFDIYNLDVVPPDSSCEGHTHDFMSYGCATRWVSVYTWNKIVDAFRTENASAALERAQESSVQMIGRSFQNDLLTLRIGGVIHPEGSVSLSPITQITTDLPDYDVPDSPYRLVVRDAGGEEIFSRAFQPYEQTHSEDGTLNFYELIPVLEDAAAIEIERDGEPIGVISASENAPTVQITQPGATAVWGQAETFTVSWEGDDPDGDTLHYRVELQRDGEDGWMPVYGDTTLNQVELDPSLLPGYGGAWNLRVQATDGFHSSFDRVGPITIEPQAPQAGIALPLEGRPYAARGSLDLMGFASDIETAQLPEDALTWYLNGEQIGTGSILRIDMPAEGQHELRFAAESSSGLVGEAMMTLTVDRDSDSDGMTNGWEDRYGLASLNPADAGEDGDGDGLTNYEEFNLQSDPTLPDTDGDGYPDLEESASGTDPNDSQSYPRHQHAPINISGTIHAHDGNRLSQENPTNAGRGGDESAQESDAEETMESEAEQEAYAGERPGGRIATVYLVMLAFGGLVVVGGLLAGVLWFRRRSA